MRLKELIAQSWEALARNRLRSVLTMMGIVWGSQLSFCSWAMEKA